MSKEENSVSPSEMEPNDLPDVPAFQDEFTRDFLQSTEQTKEGYYPFRSGSDSFTMDFPEDMTVNKRSYEIGSENRSEFITMSHTDTQREAFLNQRMSYISFLSDPENSRERMRSSSDKNLEFNEIETEHKGQHLEIAEYENDSLHVTAALIWNESNQGISIFSHIDCRKDLNENQCAESKETQKDAVIEMLKSIQFTEKESE